MQKAIREQVSFTPEIFDFIKATTTTEKKMGFGPLY
jgi:hypothetical protein